MSSSKKLLVSFLLTTTLVSSHAQDLMIPVDLGVRIDQSAMIIEGRVISTGSYWNAQHNLIYTAYTIEVYKTFKGDLSRTEVELISEGGTVGNYMHRLEPNLEMQAGDVGIFMLEPTTYDKNPQSRIPAAATYRAFALSQGFLKYNEREGTATDVFNRYDNISAQLYDRITQRTGHSYQEIRPYSIQGGVQRNSRSQAAPVINAISPTSISAGTKSQLTITGSNFGATMDTSTVGFKNANDGGATYYITPSSEIVSWSDTEIVVNVPSSAGTGQVQVTVPTEGTATSAETLTVTFANLNVQSGGQYYLTRLVEDNGNGGYTFSYYTDFNANFNAKDAFERALLSWRCGTLVNWQVGPTNVVNTTVFDGINNVRFDVGSELPAGVLGRASSYYTTCNGSYWYVAEIDIRFNDGTNWYYGTGNPGGSQSDFESVALHEMGHGHQLGHVIQLGAVMHYGLVTGSFNRVLSANDLAGGNTVMTRSTSNPACGQTVMTALPMGNCGLSSIGDYRSKQTGNWSNGANWEVWNGSSWATAIAPPTSSDGVITIRNGHTITVSSSTNADQIVVESGGTLTINSNFTVDDGTGTDLIINGTLNVDANMPGAGNIVINGTLNWLSGIVSNSLTVTGIGTMSLSGASGKTFSGGTLLMQGTTTWSDGNLNISSGDSLVNEGTITASFDHTLAGPGVFVNSATGTFTKTAGAGQGKFGTITTNNGTINCSSGILQISGAFTNTGIVNLASGTTLQNSVSGVLQNGTLNVDNASLITDFTFTVNNPISFTGTCSWEMKSTVINVAQDLNSGVTVVQNSIVQGTGSLTLHGSMTWNDGNMNIPFTALNTASVTITTNNGKTINSGGMYLNQGTITWNGSSNFVVGAGSTLQNEGTINADYDFVMNGSGTFINTATGVFTKSGGSGVGSFTIVLTNNGVINHNSGTIMEFDGPGGGAVNNAGTINVSSGLILRIVNPSVDFNNTGTLNINSATIRNNGRFNLNNPITFTGTCTFETETSNNSSAGTFVNVSQVTGSDVTVEFNSGYLQGSGSLTVNGVMNWKSINVVARIALPVTIGSTGTLNLVTTNDKRLQHTLTNQGVVNWNEGIFELRNGTVVNEGTFNVNCDSSMVDATSTTNLFNNSASGMFIKTAVSGTTQVDVPFINSGTVKGLFTLQFTNTFTADGSVEPGLSPGILTINGSEPFSANSTLKIEVAGNGGAGQPGGHDQLQRNGSLNLNGTLEVVETGAVPQAEYTIIDLSSGTVNGTFSSLNIPAGYLVFYFTDSVVIRKACVADVTIDANPGNSICEGTNVTFTATPVNGGTPTYQWQLNGTDVGTNSPMYQNATLSNGDVIRCIMTSSLGCATPPMDTSNNITMNVSTVLIPSISINANPGTTVCNGTNVMFTATPVNGGSSPVYQWKLNGVDVGTNSPAYQNNSLIDGDVVTCVLTSSAPCASPVMATSNNLVITVNAILTPSVSISAGPGSTICAGTNVTFTATPVNGGPAPGYQWKLNGSDVGNNTDTYSSTTLSDNDVVSCVMTSSYACPSTATATSNNITMTVNPVLVPSVSISASPGNTICDGTNVTFTATPVNGGSSPSYQWKLNGINVGTNSDSYSNATLNNGDVVTCELTSNALCATPPTVVSNSVSMTVNPILTPSISISASPGNTICAGTNVTFTATPTNGGSSPSYQWKLNGVNVGANSDTYQNSSLANGDMISCEMTSNALCLSTALATSNTITMTVTGLVVPSVSISASPGISICEGTNVTFTATPVNGGLTPSYQWKLNGTNVGSNSETYQNASLATGDKVSCVLTSSFACASPNTATSNEITMTVNPILAPSVTISADPGTTICAGTGVTFTATPVNGGGTPAYQWKVNGINAGSNSSTYTTSALADGDIVTCELTPSIPCPVPATATSNTISMTVNPVLAPSVSIAANPGNIICNGTNVIFTATPVNGGVSPAYQWKLNGVNVGTNSDTYQNAALANGDIVTCVLTPSIPCPVPATASSNTISMTVNPVLTPSVTISANPGSTICAGTGVTFTATPVNGGTTPVYQWKLNGVNVGTNSDTYVNATLVDGDIITCELTSNATCAMPSTVSSNQITMTVNPILTPSLTISASPGNTICVGTNVTFTANSVNGGATPAYQWKLNGGNVGSNSNTYTNNTLSDGDIITCVMTTSVPCPTVPSATSNAVTMSVTGTVVPSLSISANPGTSICNGTSVTFTATPVNGGSSPSYQWKLNGNNVGSNSASYSNNAIVDGDVITCTMTSSFPCAVPSSATSNTLTMTVTQNVTPSVTIAVSPGNTICDGISVTFTATPVNGGSTPMYQWKLNGVNVGANSDTYTSSTLADGDIVTCEMTSSITCVTSAMASSNTITMTVNPILIPSVSISAAPSTIICAGTNITFTAVPANGGASPSYQWKLNGADVGTDNDTYQNSTLADGDMVSVVMTSSVPCPSVASATSNTITITVNPLLTPLVNIIASPGNTVCEGTNVTFAATPVNGGVSPVYQWKLNGTDVGTNIDTYQNPALADGDVVSCLLTSSETCASPATGTSNLIMMTVNTAPAITVQPVSQASFVGADVTFTVGATGSGLTYQWRKDGVDIPGANADSYTISGLVLSDAGDYDVVISGTCPPSVTSATAVLTVSTVSISTQPSNTSACVGTSASFGVVANGTGLTYQWQVSTGGPFTDIANATTATLLLNNVTLSMNGNQYRCVISGSLNSDPAVLTVNPLPVVTLGLPVDSIYLNTPVLILVGGLPVGGVYSGTGISSGIFLPGNNGQGDFQVTYDYTDANGCSSSATDVFTVLPQADLVNIYPNPVASGNATIVVVPALVGGTATAYNAAGQKVESWLITGRRTTYQFKWATGHYTIIFRNVSVEVSKQIIIAR